MQFLGKMVDFGIADIKWVKVIVWPFEFRGVTRLSHSIRYNKLEARQIIL